MKYRNLTGKTFGMVKVLERVENDKNNQVRYKCLCECGNVFIALSSNLHAGRTKSCACMVGKHLLTHGMSHTSVYECWESMIQRSTNHNNVAYKYYMGRGITVCEEWKDFNKFILDMGNMPFENAEIDRIDNNKGYYKENCRWTTRSVNAHNAGKHRKTLSKYKGVTRRSDNKKWVSQICKDGVSYYLGSFENEIDAHNKYLEKSIELYGF